MAAGGSSVKRKDFKEQDFRYACGLCFEPYRGRTPKLLPCSHTFCLPCLTTLEAAVNAAQPAAGEEQDKGSDVEKGSGEKETAEQHDSSGQVSDVRVDADDVTVRGRAVGRKMIPCPSCRTAFSIPEGGVAALQTNFYVDHEESADEAPPPVLCDMCDDGHQQYATHVCRQCPRKMCGSCRRYHDKLMPQHHVTALSLCQPQEKDEKKGLCLIHRDQPLCFHCRQCDVVICLHCKLTSHDGHKTVDLASACVKAKEEVMSLMTTAQQQVQTVDTAMRSVDHQERQLTLHVQDMTQEIRARADVLVTRILQSRDQVLEELKVKEDAVKSQLCSEKMSMTVTKDTLTALVSRALHSTGGDPDVLVLRKELGVALLTEDKLDLYQQLAARQEPIWEWRYDVTDASVIQPEDVKAYMGRVVEGADADVTKPVSLRELDSRVDSWMKDTTESTTAINTKVTDIKTKVTDISTKVTDINTKVTDISTKVTDNTDNITNISTKVTDINTKVTDINTKVTDNTDNINDINTKVTDNTDNITNLMTQLATVQTDMAMMKKDKADLEEKTTSLTDDISSLRNNIGKTRELFEVAVLNTDVTKRYNPMVFQNVEFNVDDCYNKETGTFTAPETGTYFFTATVRSSRKGVTVKASITVDDDWYTPVSAGSSGGSGCVLVALTAGQEVWLEADSDVGDFNDLFCSFRGSLVQAAL